MSVILASSEISGKGVQNKETHLFFPGDLLNLGMGLDLALEVDIVALLDVGGVQLGAESERHDGRI